jgi:hypothetical protein
MSIAGPSGFCVRCEGKLEEDMGGGQPRSAFDDFVKGLFGVGNVSARRTREAGIEVITEQIQRRFPGLRNAGDPPPGFTNPPPPAGVHGARAGRVSPEAIARRKANLAARGVLGFEPDEALTEASIRARRRDLVSVWHTDGKQTDPTRELMLRKINDAANLLIAAAKPAAAPG